VIDNRFPSSGVWFRAPRFPFDGFETRPAMLGAFLRLD